MSDINNSYKTDMINRAYRLALKAHENQVDKGGKPYIEHVMKVASSFVGDYETRIVALLHDVIEDTPYTLEDIIQEGFSKSIIEAISVITKSDDMDYMEYIEAISNNEIARKVKIADLRHNMDISRIPNPSKQDFERIIKYQKALVYLEKTNGEDTK